jgi:hypothetical protein
MGLRRVFQKAAVTAFKVAGDIPEASASYVVKADDGFGTTSTDSYSIDLMVEKFTEKEGTNYSFSELIQVKDLKGLVPSLSCSVALNSQNTVIDAAGVSYNIEALDIDAADALYVLLLRKV